MEEFTVKAREHQGTKSLDLTIPTKIVKECRISPKDVFKVVAVKDKDAVKLEYTRVYAKQ